MNGLTINFHHIANLSISEIRTDPDFKLKYSHRVLRITNTNGETMEIGLFADHEEGLDLRFELLGAPGGGNEQQPAAD